MSTVSQTIAKATTTKAHNVLFWIQGMILSAVALHGDLPTILGQIQTLIPMLSPLITGVIHLIYSEKKTVLGAFSAAKSQTLSQTAIQALPLLADANADAAQVKNTLATLVTTIHTAETA